jgi:hypothetical protein
MILAGIIGFAIAQSKKTDEKKQLAVPEPQRALPPIEPSPTQMDRMEQSINRQITQQLAAHDTAYPLMLAAIKHAEATKDPRDYRAASILAVKAGRPKSAKTLASIADERAREIASKAKKVGKVAKVTGDPRALDVFAGLVEQIDQTELARRARRAAKAIRNGEVG